MYCIRYDIQLGGVLTGVGGGRAYLLLLALRDANSSISVILVSRNPSRIVLVGVIK